MNHLLFLATEKISADNLFEGFNVDLQATADLLKNLSDYNPTVWNYVSSITTQVMTPLGVAIMTVLLVMEFSVLARKLATQDGKATFEYFAPFIIKLAFAVIFIPNSLAVVETIISIGIYVVEGMMKIVSNGGIGYDSVSGLKGQGIVGKVIIAFFSLLIFLCRLVSFAIINILVILRFIQLYPLC